MNKHTSARVNKRKPVMTVRPSLINALFPLFFKNLIFFSLITFSIYILINLINNISNNLIYEPSMNTIILIILALTFLSISIKFTTLKLTKYIFYENNAVKDFKFIIINRRSVMYDRITNITLKVSLWDRITGAGKIILHTGDDELPDIIMKYIKDPAKIEELIYSLIRNKNNDVHQKIIK